MTQQFHGNADLTDWVTARQMVATPQGPEELGPRHLIRAAGQAPGGHVVAMDKITSMCGHLTAGPKMQLLLQVIDSVAPDAIEHCKTCYNGAATSPHFVLMDELGFTESHGVARYLERKEPEPGKSKGPSKDDLRRTVRQLEAELDAWRAWADKSESARPDRQVS